MDDKLELYGQAKTEEQFYKEEAYLRAQRKVKKLIGFYWHAVSYVIVNAFIVGILVSSGVRFGSISVWSTAFFWGIGLAFHAFSVWGPDILFGRNWEQRKIREFMEQDNGMD